MVPRVVVGETPRIFAGSVRGSGLEGKRHSRDQMDCKNVRQLECHVHFLTVRRKIGRDCDCVHIILAFERAADRNVRHLLLHRRIYMPNVEMRGQV
jgi:hypothetical protein